MWRWTPSGWRGFERRLRAAGQAYDLRRQPEDGGWQLFVTDPDGARI